MAILQQVFTVPSMVTGASITSAVETPGLFVYAYLEVPTMTAYSASTPIYIQCSSDGVTFRRYSNPESNTSTAGINDFSIASSVSNRIVNVPQYGCRYLKVEVSGTVTGAVVPAPFKLITVSNQ